MKNNETFKKELYQTLGSLFYAVAYVDGVIEKAEVVKLENCVKERWLNVDESQDEFGSDAAFQIISVFDWMANEKISYDKAYGVFYRFSGKYCEWLDDTLKEKILKTANDISLAFRGENKHEHALIEKIKSLFNRNSTRMACSIPKMR